MLALLSTWVSWVAWRFRSRAELELELIALRHQVAVLNRQQSGRLRLCSIDRMLWVWLYRVWPRCLKAILVVKPATVVQWHRQGFRLYWLWRSRPGRRPIGRETRKLIREMCFANPLWGAPRIHGELLKLGIKISQATVAKYMVRRPQSPSPTWRSFLRTETLGIAAIDMFIVPSATFRLLFVMLILAHDRRKIVRFDVTQHPTAGWLSRQVTEAFPWDSAPRFLLRDRDSSYGVEFSKRVDAMGITEVLIAPQSPWQKSLCREGHRLDPSGVFGPPHHLQRTPFARVLSSYEDYYHRTRTHLSLGKDCPKPRPVHPPTHGKVIAIPQVGGLHHRYERLAA